MSRRQVEEGSGEVSKARSFIDYRLLLVAPVRLLPRPLLGEEGGKFARGVGDNRMKIENGKLRMEDGDASI